MHHANKYKILAGRLVGIYGISTLEGYLMLNPLYTHKHTHDF